MAGLVDFVARLKSWQVFILLVAPLIASVFYTFTALLGKPASELPLSVEQYDSFLRHKAMISAVQGLLPFGWLLSLGISANWRVKKDLRESTKLAVGSAVLVSAYILVTTLFIPKNYTPSDGGTSSLFFWSFHVLMMAAIVYVFAFTARNITMAEKQSPIAFSDYSGPFFLFWFYPIGVWLVQPRSNRIAMRAPAQPQ